MRKYRPNYTLDEVEGLIDFYPERSSFTTKTTWLVRYCDLDKAIPLMPRKEFEAVITVGLMSIPLRYAAKQFNVTKDTMNKRYKRGLEWITYYLNTGKYKRF